MKIFKLKEELISHLESQNSKKIRSFVNLNPEAIAPVPESEKILIFSDDGTVAHSVDQEDSFDKLVDGKCACKSLKDPRKKRFRSLALILNKQNVRWGIKESKSELFLFHISH